MPDNPYTAEEPKKATTKKTAPKADEHATQHVTRPPCDECAKEQKRLALIAGVVGAVAGMAFVYVVARRD